MASTDCSALDREICGSVWTSPHAQTLMQVLGYDIGPRPAGSKAYKDALKLLSGELERMGARDVRSEPVPVLAWRSGESRVVLLSPHRREYESVHHVHSAAAAVNGPLVDVGAGASDELDRLGSRLSGAVALVAGHQVSGGKVKPHALIMRDLAARGAAAILMRCMQPGLGPSIELAVTSAPLPIPVVGVSHEAGHELAALAARGAARLRVEATGSSYRTRCRNLIAEIGPAADADGVVVLSAHLDYFHISAGAFDNLTGVVSMLEIARALAPFQAQFRRTLRLIAFTAEEYGFAGSKYYVGKHADELDAIRFVLNLDSLFNETARGTAVMWAPAMRDYIDQAFRQAQRCVEVRNMFCMSSDYLPFMLAGIAAARPADFRDAFPPWSHTRSDTPDKIPPEWIRLNAMTYAQLLVRMLTDPEPLPVRRKSPEEVRALVDQADAREALEAGGSRIP